MEVAVKMWMVTRYVDLKLILFDILKKLGAKMFMLHFICLKTTEIRKNLKYKLGIFETIFLKFYLD